MEPRDGLLDQVRAQLDALQPRLGRGDRVEDGGAALLLHLGSPLLPVSYQRVHVVRHILSILRWMNSPVVVVAHWV